jgi:Zn-dependent metalloprotease
MLKTLKNNNMKYFLLPLLFLCTISLNAQFKKVDKQPNIVVQKSDKTIETKLYGNKTSNQETIESSTYHSIDESFLTALSSGLKPGIKNELGLPTYIEGRLTNSSINRGNSVDLAFEYLSLAAPLMKVDDVMNSFKLVIVDNDDLGMTHVKMQQLHKNIPIFGAEIIIHGENNVFDFLNGTYYSSLADFDVVPVLSEEQGNEVCYKDLKDITVYDKEMQSVFGDLSTKNTLVIYPKNGEFHLAYHITTYKNLVERWEYFIEAKTGNIIHKHESICKFHNHKHDSKTTCTQDAIVVLDGKATASSKDLFDITRTINTYDVAGKFYLIDGSRDIFATNPNKMPNDPNGVIWTIDAFDTSPQKSNFNYDHLTSTNNVWNNKTGVSAHYNGGKAFEYFRISHNRKSINGSGGNIVSLINVADDDGSSMGNAYWNGTAMFYGNGDNFFLPLARGLDVAGHEMSHGVIQNTANLIYEDEPGALNESFADVFGVLIDRDDWKIGEDVVKVGAFPSGALRDMSNPHNGAATNDFNRGWQPKHYSERFKGQEDNGGVHINSGIPNHAFFLFATAVGKDKAEKVYYRALSTYLTKSSKFIDCRVAVVKATTDLYGTTEINAAKKAFDDVGIQGEQGGSYEVDVNVNPGQEFVLVTSSSNTGLFLYTITGTLIGTVSNKGVGSKPSVSDDGSEIVFVGTDKKLHYVFLDWTQSQIVPQEQILGSSPVWRNVVISKDGLKIAAVTQDNVNEIIVFHFGSTTTQNTFTLFNPTFSEGVSTGDVNFADAMEFDINGEYVMYDAENEINSNTSGSIQYWDISFIKVWNNKSNSFSIGKIDKLFSSLPENVSVGNPTFSKNSPYIMAFDYIDENGDVDILGANTETGNLGTIYQNNTLGYPNYSSKDNKLVFDNDGTSTTNTAVLNLKTNKIEATTNPSLFISGKKWAVWFSNGKRVLSSSEDKNILKNEIIKLVQNPITDRLNLRLLSTVGQSIEISIKNMFGQVVYNNKNERVSDNAVSILTNDWPEGAYVLSVQYNNEIHSLKVIKVK